MQQIKWMLKGGAITLVLLLVMTFTFLVMSELNGRSLAQVIDRPVVTGGMDTGYARLADAPPQRDITVQRFAPVEVAQ